MTAPRWPPRTSPPSLPWCGQSKPTATNAEIRAVLQQTAQDLGTAGRDVYYGYGLVQAKAAIDALGGGGGGDDCDVCQRPGRNENGRQEELDRYCDHYSQGCQRNGSFRRHSGRQVQHHGSLLHHRHQPGQCSVSTTLKLTVHQRHLHGHQPDRHRLRIRPSRQQRSGWRQQRHNHHHHEVNYC